MYARQNVSGVDGVGAYAENIAGGHFTAGGIGGQDGIPVGLGCRGVSGGDVFGRRGNINRPDSGGKGVGIDTTADYQDKQESCDEIKFLFVFSFPTDLSFILFFRLFNRLSLGYLSP